MVRETIVLMLEDDYEIDQAATVNTALACLRAAAPSAFKVMLLDCLLPDGNPRDLLAEADRHQIPVVLISGDPNQAAAMNPPRRFLPKPFSRATLLAVLDTARG